MRVVFLMAVLFYASAVIPARAECSEGSQADMNECARNQANAVDAELATLISDIKAKLDPKEQVRFDEAQKAWIEYRNKDCLFRIGGERQEGGTIWPWLANQCRSMLTRERIKSLKGSIDLMRDAI